MEITSFVLGVCAVIVLLMIVGTFMNYMTTKRLQQQIRNHDTWFEGETRIRSQQHNDCINYTDTINNNVVDELNQLKRYTDSRVDKVINELERIKKTYIKEY